MRKWISIMMMVAMVVTTIMPAASHASMQHSEKATATASAPDGHECDHHGQKILHNKQTPNKKPCCDKSMCKCIGGNCHNGVSGIFGNGNGDLRNFASSNASFGYAEEYIESAYLSRLKRPPKA